MKKNIIIKFLAGISVLSLAASCNYEEINTNPYEMTDEMGKMDGLSLGSYITTMERYVLPVGTQADRTDMINEYQIAYHLSADCWSGYFGQDNNWGGGNNNTTYYLNNGWLSATYKDSYTNVLPSWKKIKATSEKLNAPEVFALAEILKISCWHKTLESFGPIPYTHAGEMALVIPFDSEKDVYTAMFNDLKAAIEVLTPFAETNATIVADYDAVYAGSARQWVKYANSLMLRLAMRIRYADEAMSKQWVGEALNHNIGLMTAANDAAQMSTGAGYVFVNNIQYLAESYEECRVATSVYAYLNGYHDPRLGKYMKSSPTYSSALTGFDGEKYAPIPSGTANPKGTYAKAALPNMTSSTPTYWMRTSEVLFLKAEAALVWPEFGDAADLYKKGVEMSFEENGLSAAAADAYLTTALKPEAVSIFGYTAPAPTEATTEFNGTTEQKLEKIMIQKWIALYPNGQEAWTEWRRTGYPVLNQVKYNYGTGYGVTKEDRIRRMMYPESFYQSEQDKANYQDALSKLGGEDSPTTRLWWDCKK